MLRNQERITAHRLRGFGGVPDSLVPASLDCAQNFVSPVRYYCGFLTVRSWDFAVVRKKA